MDEKSIKKEEEQPTKEKKVYTPPTLTVYGKISELTASGKGSAKENTQHPGLDRRS